MNKLSINLKYIIWQGAYWMIFSGAGGFTALYLQENGYAETQIGIIYAVFSLISAISQPFMGNLSDRIKKITWKKMTLFLGVVILFVSSFMIFSKNPIINAALISLIYISANLCLPFINAAHYYYENMGQNINYGVARGFGSGIYALSALIIGILIQKTGIISIPIFTILATIIFILLTIYLPYEKKVETNNLKENDYEKTNFFKFIKKYPAFNIMLISVFFMYFSHNNIGVFLLQIIQSVGGDGKQLGSAIAIQAFLEIPILFSFSYILKKVKVNRLMIVSAIGFLIKSSFYLIAKNMTMIYIAQSMQMFSLAIIVAASVYYTGRMVKKEDQNTGQALMVSMSALATVVGSVLSGWIIENLGISTMLMMNVLMSLIGVFIAILSYYIENNYIRG